MRFNRYKPVLSIPFAPTKSFSLLTDEEASNISLIVLLLFSAVASAIKLRESTYLDPVSVYTVVFGGALFVAFTVGSVLGCFLQAYLIAGALSFINNDDVTTKIRWAVPFSLLPYLAHSMIKIFLTGKSILYLDILVGLWSFWILVSLLSFIKKIPMWKAAAAVLLLGMVLALPIALMVWAVYYFNY
jgi:hypothetical protein